MALNNKDSDSIRIKLESIFEEACKAFALENQDLFEVRSSEQSICGALMIALYETLKNSEYPDYKVDVEYNRYKLNPPKTDPKFIHPDLIGASSGLIRCDLVVHKRGKADNLIAIEMKKHACGETYKENDRARLCVLTNPTDEFMNKKDELEKFKQVFCYKLGVYAEIDLCRRVMQIEYYSDGDRYAGHKISLKNGEKIGPADSTIERVRDILIEKQHHKALKKHKGRN